MNDMVCSSGGHFDILDDNIVEDDESFSLTVFSANPDVLTFGSPSEFVVNILDDSDCKSLYYTAHCLHNRS